MLHLIQKPRSRPSSTSSSTDADVVMKDLIELAQNQNQNKNDHADEKQTQYQNDRGRSTEKKSQNQQYDKWPQMPSNQYYQPHSCSNGQNSQHCSGSNGQYQNRSGSNGSQSRSGYSASKERRHQEGGQNQTGYRPQHSQNPQPTSFRPQLIEFNGKHFYQCVPCNSLHEANIICSKNSPKSEN